MGNMSMCLQCGGMARIGEKVCPHCGFKRYGQHDEYYPGRKRMKTVIQPKDKMTGFSDEEILAIGLYPKEEGYKMSLISRILGKK